MLSTASDVTGILKDALFGYSNTRDRSSENA